MHLSPSCCAACATVIRMLSLQTCALVFLVSEQSNSASTFDSVILAPPSEQLYKHYNFGFGGRKNTSGAGAVPSTLAMTVVTSKLAASAAIMTPPGMPKTRNLASTAGLTPCLMACPTVATVTSGVAFTYMQTDAARSLAGQELALVGCMQCNYLVQVSLL